MSKPHPQSKVSLVILLLEFIGPLLFFALATLAAGVALGAAFFCYESLSPGLDGLVPWLHYPATGALLALSYYIYGFTLMIVAPLLCTLLGGRLRPFRGPAVSPRALGWYVQATLVMLVRYSCYANDLSADLLSPHGDEDRLRRVHQLDCRRGSLPH
jgi:hypothetical protein